MVFINQLNDLALFNIFCREVLMKYNAFDSNQNFRQQQKKKKPYVCSINLNYPYKLIILIRKVNVETMPFSVSWPK